MWGTTAGAAHIPHVIAVVQADNPGLWFYHCHIVWHQLMGQGLIFVTGVDQIEAPPPNLPQCGQQCNYDHAPFNPD